MKSFVHHKSEAYLQHLFDSADIRINGTRPWDIQVHDSRFYPAVLCGGSLALGESYMEGWWECDSLNRFFFQLLRSRAEQSMCRKIPDFFRNMKCLLSNRQNKKRAFQVGEHHYDAGNDLFTAMLDKYMTYSCGYWRSAQNLDEAQEAKLDLICRKLGLKPGMRMLDIGCGWGSLALYAAEHYGVEVVGVTVSEEQAKHARERCSQQPVAIRLQDYREVSEQFDAIASVGMFEHVGYRNYRTFMEVVHRCLKKDGLFLLHTIGSNRTVYSCDPWFDRYIFPNGMLPSIEQVGKAVESNFVMEDWQNFNTDYEKTLLSWWQNFEQNWEELTE